MGLRNKLFRKIKNSLLEEGLPETEVLKLARKAVEDRTDTVVLKSEAFPAGQSGADGVGLSKVPGTHLRMDRCDKDLVIKCNKNSLYREIDGKCNNLQYPLYGVASTPFIRAVKGTPWNSKPIKQNLKKLPFFRPCIPRKKSQAPEFLPSARLVSTTIHKATDISDQFLTHMVTQFAQFLDHDITLTPEEEHPNNCCGKKDDENCFTIAIPSDDSFYSTIKKPQDCLSFHRSTQFCEHISDIEGKEHRCKDYTENL